MTRSRDTAQTAAQFTQLGPPPAQLRLCECWHSAVSSCHLVTCFIQILQCSATLSPMLATTRLLFTELSSNLGSTLRAAATGSPAAAAHTRSQDKYSSVSPFTLLFAVLKNCHLSVGKSMNFPDRLKRCTGAISADVCTADIFGPIIGSIRPEIWERFYIT